jgi:CDP-diacylglycerol--glycerol-3-phosphate 3-phosphatidyltransferase
MINMPSIPDTLSYFRLASVPVLLTLAWAGYPIHFLVLLILSLISDVADGFIARRLRIATARGAKLDSWADLCVYMTAPLCVWWLWSDLVWQNMPYVIMVVVCCASTPFLGWMRFDKLPSLHLYSAKLSAVLLSISFFILIFLDISWPFRVAAVVTVISTLEEWLVIALLDMYRSNVKSIFHVLRLKEDYQRRS